MNLSLQTKVTLYIVAAVLAVGIGNTSLHISDTRRVLEKELIERGITLAEALSSAINEGVASEDLDFIKKFSYIVHTKEVTLAQVYSTLWLPIDSAPISMLGVAPAKGAKEHFEKRFNPYFEARDEWFDFYAPVYYHNFEPSKTKPAEWKRYLIGYVRLRMTTDHMKKATREAVVRSLFVSIMVTALTILLIHTFVRRKVLLPVKALQKSVALHKKGELPAEVSTGTVDDEIGMLAQEFNFMIRAIREREQRLDEEKERLRRSEGRLRESQEVARIGSWDLDLVSRKLEWSDETYKLFDKIREEFVPSFDAFARLVHPDDRETMQTNFNHALRSDDTPYHVAVRIINDSGREWVMEAFGAVRRHKDGSPIGIFGTAQDITGQKKTEEALRQKEEMMRNLLDGVDEGFIVVDRDYRILSANWAYCNQVGLNPADVLGKHCYEISHRVSRPCYENGEECSPRSVFKTGEPHVSIHRYPDHDNDVIYVETKAFPLKDSSGQVTSVIEVINDITEKQLLEEQRLKTQKLAAVGILAGGIAHDFNNLLQGVFGYISMAKMNLDKRQKCLDMLEQAEKALHMSVNLTTQLLTFSKGGKPVKKSIELGPVIENSVKFALSGSRVDYRIEIDESPWMVDADEGQIGQMIQNIVVNAEQAMPMGGTVSIRANNVRAPQKGLPPTLPHGNYVGISINDQGIGISEEYLSKIFDPYFTTKDKGSGLGLATSYSIIRNHGGMVDVKSELGKGSTFFFWLPAIEKEEGKTATVQGSAPVARKCRILLLDDEELVRNIAGEMIRSLGHEVEFAVNGEEAISRYRESLLPGRKFDIVILDLTIRGGMGGEEVIKALLAMDPDIKAVVSSGYGDSSALSEYQALGFRACLAKPYSVAVLKDRLNSLMD